MKFTNILFPVDNSDRCRNAVPHVLAAVQQFQARLTLLHVVEYPPLAFYGDGVYLPETLVPDLKEAARRMIADFARTAFPGMEAATVVEQGDPGIIIVDLARSAHIDLIMMPTHGHGRFRSALLGSVTGKVLHDATCAVWTDAHATTTPGRRQPANKMWQTILCALNTGPNDVELIRFAGELAVACGAAIRLVHAVPSPEPGTAERGIAGADPEFTQFLKESARTSLAAMQVQAGTNFTLSVVAGPVSKVVATEAQRFAADLVLIGRGSLTKFAGRLRTNEYGIIRDAGCPVLSI